MDNLPRSDLEVANRRASQREDLAAVLAPDSAQRLQRKARGYAVYLRQQRLGLFNLLLRGLVDGDRRVSLKIVGPRRYGNRIAALLGARRTLLATWPTDRRR